MRFHLRSRSARRKAALRLLHDMSDSCPRASGNALAKPMTGESPLVALARDESWRSPESSLYIECAGRPYLIGPGTLLVATYLARMQHGNSRIGRDDDPPAPDNT